MKAMAPRNKTMELRTSSFELRPSAFGARRSKLEARRSKPRKGLSLLEVIVALSIFLFALVAIARLVNLGSDLALDVEQRSRATQLCQSKLSEVVSGAVTLTSQSDTPFDEDPNWTWSLDCEQTSVTGLWNVTVKASHQGSDGNKVLMCSLSQMVLDPSIRGTSYDAVTSPNTASNTANDQSSSSGSSSSSSSSSSASPTPSTSPPTTKSPTSPSGPSKGGS
jgi:general secretion pathway protein I